MKRFESPGPPFFFCLANLGNKHPVVSTLTKSLSECGKGGLILRHEQVIDQNPKAARVNLAITFGGLRPL